MKKAVMDAHFRSFTNPGAGNSLTRFEERERMNRARVSDDVDRFLAAGGSIQEVPPGVSGHNFTVRQGKGGRIHFVENRFSQIHIGNKSGRRGARP